jgi:hypothetical protein
MTGHAPQRLAKIGFDVDSCKPCHAMHADPAEAWGQMLSPRFLKISELASVNPVINSEPGSADPVLNERGNPPSGSSQRSTTLSTTTAPVHSEGALPCLVCHHSGGPAPVRDIATHPSVAFVNLTSPNDPGYMPLFNDHGRVDPKGQITCRTCHLSHGQKGLLETAANNRTLSPDEQRSARMQLRPFVAPNLCTQCHGDTARLKFLFFHNVAQRSKS